MVAFAGAMTYAKGRNSSLKMLCVFHLFSQQFRPPNCHVYSLEICIKITAAFVRVPP